VRRSEGRMDALFDNLTDYIKEESEREYQYFNRFWDDEDMCDDCGEEDCSNCPFDEDEVA